jgi:hypothetical protein
MDLRSGTQKRMDLRDKCFEIVTEDRRANIQQTKLRGTNIGLNGLLKLATRVTRYGSGANCNP